MLLKTVAFISECTATCLSLLFNLELQYLIKTKTPEEIRPYAKILRQNSLVDTLFTQMEVDKGECILIQGGFFRHVSHPWNGLMLLAYIAALYFCISSDFAPFFYRYMLIVKGRKLTNFEFYMLYVITGCLSIGVSIWLYYAVWPSTTPEGRQEFLHAFTDDYWIENGTFPIFVASHLKNPVMIGTTIWAMSLVSSTYGSITYFCIKTMKHLKEKRHTMTEKTRKLQKNLTFSLIAQAIAPMCLAVLPVMMILACMLFDWGITHLGVVLINVVSWVAVLNPLCVIMLVGPYRDAFLRRQRKSMIKHTIIKWRESFLKKPQIGPTGLTHVGITSMDTSNVTGLELAAQIDGDQEQPPGMIDSVVLPN